MGENIECVFLPVDFKISDIIAVSMLVEEQLETIPTLTLVIDGNELYLNNGVQIDNKLTWTTESLEKFKETHTESKSFKIHYFDKEQNCNLSKLVFLGPIKTAKLPPNVFVLEFNSGFFIDSEFVTDEVIKFNVDFILTLDYRNVSSIKTQLDELDNAQQSFEETKNRLIESGLDLNELSQLKLQYEQSMREKRRVQHDFIDQNQKMQAATIITQNEQDRIVAVDALKAHIQVNKDKRKFDEPDKEYYQKMKQYRTLALNELSIIFPFTDAKNFCTVNYYAAPSNAAQFNEMRSYLGFATHYIREISRILGIPLPFVLYPQALSSRITSRLSDKSVLIPTDFNAVNVKNMQSYEQTLIDCAKHIIKSLVEDTNCGQTLPDYIAKLRSIDDTMLTTLIPTPCQ